MRTITASEFADILKKDKIDPNELQRLAVEKLLKSGKKVATAESCTGGLISKRITEVSGSSGVFDCGVCSYANFIKHKLLGVSEDTLATVGAVSPETAEQMSAGVRALAQADFGVSTTGIAGPTGGTPEKPVGLVYISVSCESETAVVRTLLGDAQPPTRENIRKIASDIALWLLIKQIP
ncbi:MAG: CinA family protein [Ruminococcus sp.]|nr:CinA family protein [Ruminococcus sp.]